MARTRARRPRRSSTETDRSRTSKPAIVLLVEDEADLRVLAESNITEFGYTTLSAASSREALVLLEEHKDISVLFTDINLPDSAITDPIDGLELARRAVKLCPGLRVVYTSGGVPTDGMISLFMENSTFLRKPYNRDELRGALGGSSDG